MLPRPWSDHPIRASGLPIDFKMARLGRQGKRRAPTPRVTLIYGTRCAKTKANVERPFRYVREGPSESAASATWRTLKRSCATWRDTVTNARVHATTCRVGSETFVEERCALGPFLSPPSRAVLKLEQRVPLEGAVSAAGSLYRIPDAVRRRIGDVHVLSARSWV